LYNVSFRDRRLIMTVTQQDNYEKAVFNLHRLHVLLEDVFPLPQGAGSFPATRDPMEYVASRLKLLTDEITLALPRAEMELKECPAAESTP